VARCEDLKTYTRKEEEEEKETEEKKRRREKKNDKKNCSWSGQLATAYRDRTIDRHECNNS
jgi:hypothetical protein